MSDRGNDGRRTADDIDRITTITGKKNSTKLQTFQMELQTTLLMFNVINGNRNPSGKCIGTYQGDLYPGRILNQVVPNDCSHL